MRPQANALAITPDLDAPAPTEAGQAAVDAARALGRRACRARDAAGLQGGLGARRRLVRGQGVRSGAGRARDRWRRRGSEFALFGL